jgi:hypothetical protein
VAEVSKTTNDEGAWFWLIGFGALFWWIYQSGFGSCDKYASDFSCGYVVDRAEYEVFYWRNLQDDDPNDDRPIGRVVGLRACKDTAIRYSATINEPWNDRAYICILLKDGSYMEKHRLLE